MAQQPVAESLAALRLMGDLATGAQFGAGVRAAVLAGSVAARLGLTEAEGHRATEAVLVGGMRSLVTPAAADAGSDDPTVATVEVLSLLGPWLGVSLDAVDDVCGEAPGGVAEAIRLASAEADDATPDAVAAVSGLLAHRGFLELDDAATALGLLADLRGRFLPGHSAHVATLVGIAGRLVGLSATYQHDARAAALLHDLGRTSVSSEIWDRPAPLDRDDWEQVRQHAHWTERILLELPSLVRLAPLAGSHHERLDGTGYHGRTRSIQQPTAVRLIAAADAMAAMTEPRPYRPARSRSDAAAALEADARRGRLDPDCCAAVVEAAAFSRPPTRYPDGLDELDVAVLRLATRSAPDAEVATVLARTEAEVQRRRERLPELTGVRTRAGLAVFAVLNGLLYG